MKPCARRIFPALSITKPTSFPSPDEMLNASLYGGKRAAVFFVLRTKMQWSPMPI